MSHVKVWIHAVWGTKNRYPFLVGEIKTKIIDHIKINAKSKHIHIDSINGHHDHLHCLMALNSDMSISKVMQLIKGESAFWINKEKITTSRFEWADEYFAISVSESAVKTVRSYINNQEEHHSKRTFKDEYEDFILEFDLRNHG